MTERLKRKLLLLRDKASQNRLGTITILKVRPSNFRAYENVVYGWGAQLSNAEPKFKCSVQRILL